MLGRTIDLTLRNLSTLALVCAIVLAPLHLIYGYVNRNAIAVREMAPAIEDFPEGRQVRGVGRAELDRERIGRWVLLLLVIGAIPVLLGPTRRVLAADAAGKTPTSLGALRGHTEKGPRPGPATVVGAALVAVAVIVVAEAAVAIVVPMLEDGSEWVGVAAGQTLARSLGLPFLTVALVGGARSRRSALPLDLY